MVNLYLSTIGENAAVLARKHGFGIEIAEFSYAVNMDTDFSYREKITCENLAGIRNRIFHAPFAELCPAAIDPLIMEVTRRRYNQAYKLMQGFCINNMVVHSGYIPNLYFKSWFVNRSVEFWRDFLLDKPPDFLLFLENVMEESPDILRNIVEKTGDARFQLCLDIGHAGAAFSKAPVPRWVETTAPCLGHVHVHNNYCEGDVHNPPGDGLIGVREAIVKILEKKPNVSFTAETADLKSAVSWFDDNGFINALIC